MPLVWGSGPTSTRQVHSLLPTELIREQMGFKPSEFANANIDDVVDKLTTDEAISLTAGVGHWYTFAVPRLHVPALKVKYQYISSYI